MPQALLLQSSIFLFVIILILSHLQLSLALYAHLILFTVKGNAFFQTFKLIIIRQSLLFQIQTLLLHFNLLLLIGNHLLFPFVTLVFDVTKQVRIGKNKNSITLLKQTAFFPHYLFYTSRFAGIDLDSQYGLNQSFHIYIFHEVSIYHFRYLDIPDINT